MIVLVNQVKILFFLAVLLAGGLVTWSFFYGFCALVVRGLWPRPGK